MIEFLLFIILLGIFCVGGLVGLAVGMHVVNKLTSDE